MSGRVVTRPSALRDLGEAADYIRRRSGPARATRFLRAARETSARRADTPGLGARYEPDEPSYAGLRFFPVARHRNYLVFYRTIAGGIEVLRVLHGARDIASVLDEEFGIADDAPDEDEPG